MTLTSTGALVGTPMYMSPEQVTGRIQLDHRTDIYSLGLVLHELLTLRPPITGPTRELILRNIVTKTLPPVSWQNRAIAESLEAVVHKAIAKDPDERYPSAREFAEDLQYFLDGKAVQASPYRYKFDKREIAANRPTGVDFLAHLCFVVGIPALSMCLLLLMDRDALVDVVWLFAIGLVSLAAGQGLVDGRAWSRWITVLWAVVGSGWVLYYVVPELRRIISLLTGGRADLATAGLLLFGAASVISLRAVFRTLFNQQTGDWLRLVARLRAEYKAHRPGRW